MLTGYAATKIVNERLTAVGLKTIPAQMIYQYMSKNMIKTVSVSGKKMIDPDVFESWMTKYIERKTARTTV